mmetsp:Transcript_56236/g.103167  ORF Transcript_56236/g.103167 Transcript_56236/m.103167 type:complete len:215 (+) Transcript_56236:92-736(+)
MHVLIAGMIMLNALQRAMATRTAVASAVPCSWPSNTSRRAAPRLRASAVDCSCSSALTSRKVWMGSAAALPLHFACAPQRSASCSSKRSSFAMLSGRVGHMERRGGQRWKARTQCFTMTWIMAAQAKLPHAGESPSRTSSKKPLAALHEPERVLCDARRLAAMSLRVWRCASAKCTSARTVQSATPSRSKAPAKATSTSLHIACVASGLGSTIA